MFNISIYIYNIMGIEFNTIDDAIDVIKKGGMVVVMDDESRENEGDLILAAEDATSKNIVRIHFMFTFSDLSIYIHRSITSLSSSSRSHIHVYTSFILFIFLTKRRHS